MNTALLLLFALPRHYAENGVKAKRPNRGNAGQSLIFMALVIVIVFVFVALGIDGGRLYAKQKEAKAATDASALSAGFTWVNNGDWRESGYSAMDKNGFNESNSTREITELDANQCEVLSGQAVSDNCKCFRAHVERDVPLFFLSLFGLDDAPIEAQSVSLACKSVPLENGYAIRTRHDLNVAGGGGGLVFGNIRADNDLKRTGMGHLWSFGGEITAGENIVCSGMFCNPIMDAVALGPTFFTHVQDHVQRPPLVDLDLPRPDACNTDVAPVSCSDISSVISGMEFFMGDMLNSFSGGVPNINNFSSFTGFGSFDEMLTTWTSEANDALDNIDTSNNCLVYAPGRHTQNINVTTGHMVVFLPGSHCLTRDLHVNGGMVIGHDTSFYFENAGVRIESHSQVFLDAGNFGAFDFGGMLFYRPDNVSVGAVSGTMLMGSIYAPNTNCMFDGAGMIMGKTQLICEDLRFTGGFNTMIFYDESYLYHIPAEISLID